ncbi:MAG: YncE family protein [Burkholderiales bacterium]
MKVTQKSLIVSAIAGAMILGLTANARAEGYHLVKTIQVPGVPIKVVDFSTMDQENGMMYVSDRSNRGIDVINTNNDTFVRRYGGFRGVYNGAPETSGPNIGIREGRVLWVTDAPSNVKALDIDSGKILATIDCGGGNWRIDGAALDPRNHVLMAESADTSTPYLCWIDTKSMQLVGKTEFHESTAGLEGSVWDDRTDTFFVALPEVNHVAGAVYQMNPTTHAIVKEYHLPAGDVCEAGGISLNKEHNEILVGCDAKNYTDIINLTDGTVTQTGIIGGTDQTAFDPTHHKYFIASRRGSLGSVLGVIDSDTHKLDSSPKTAPKSHAVAVNHRTGQAYVPMGPNKLPFDNDAGMGFSCTHGCIGVFAQ